MTRKLATLTLAAGTLSLIACAEGAAVDNGSFTRELALSPQVDAPKAGEQTAIRLAASREQYLAVWLDDGAIVASRVRDGELVDPRPMVIHRGSGATVPDAEGGLTVASDGRDFLVLWSERNVGSGDLDVRFSRVTGEGAVLDPGGRALAETSAKEHAPAALWTDYGWITAYRSAGAVTLVRLDSAGRLWESRVHTIAATALGDAAPALVAAGPGAFIAFGEGDVLRLARVDIAGGGEIVTDLCRLHGGELRGVAMSQLGSGYVVGFAERLGASGITSVLRLSGDGMPIDVQPVQLFDRGDRAPAVLWNGQLGLIAAEGQNGIELVPMAGYERSFGERRTIAGTTPFLANLGAESLLGFVRHEGGVIGSNTYVARVSPEGMVFDGSVRLIARGADVQQKPAIATGRYGSLVAWSDSLNADARGMDVRYAHLSLAGKVDKTATLGTAFHDFPPSVATDGQKFLVAWGDGEGAVRVVLIDEIGELIRSTRLPDGASRVAAAWNGRVYLVVGSGLLAARFERSGVALDPTMVPLWAAQGADEISLAPAGDGFLAAYHWKVPSSQSGGQDVVAALRIGPNATVPSLPMPLGFGHAPSVAWDGERHTIAWLRDGAIQAARVLPSGTWTEAPRTLELQATGVALAPAHEGSVLLSYTDGLGILRVGTLQQGQLVSPIELATSATAPALASFGERFGVAYEVPGTDATTAVRARLFLH